MEQIYRKRDPDLSLGLLVAFVLLLAALVLGGIDNSKWKCVGDHTETIYQRAILHTKNGAEITYEPKTITVCDMRAPSL